MSDQHNFRDPAETTEAEDLYLQEIYMSEQTDKPNPPRYPFVVIGPNGPLTRSDGKVAGFRKKAAAEAAEAAMNVMGLDTKIDRQSYNPATMVIEDDT